MKVKAKELFNIPNILCYIRFLLIPFFVYSYWKAETPQDYFGAAFVVFLSGLTDFLDGFIARKFHMVTEWGKAIDPIADKLSQASIVICLSLRISGMIYLLALFVIKELTMGLCCLFFLKKGQKLDGAMWFGKLSTVVFYVIMFLMIAIPIKSVAVLDTMMVISGFFLALSFLLYLRVFWQMYRKPPKKK